MASYTISTVADLQAVNNDLAGDYTLLNDIDLLELSLTGLWVPLGSELAPFTGTFDGNDFTIENLRLSFVDDASYQGLFGHVYDATITNLTIKNFMFVLNTSNGVYYYYVGGLIGRATSAGTALTWGQSGDTALNTITNCVVQNIDLSIICTTPNISGCEFDYIGGMIGSCEYLEMTDCTASGEIDIKYSTSHYPNVKNIRCGYVGGMVGEAEWDCNFTSSSSTVNITINASDYEEWYQWMQAIGGFVGSTNGGDIIDCHVTAKIYISQMGTTGVGLFGSWLDNDNILNCTATGDIDCVNCANYHFIGGFGADVAATTITDCSFFGHMTYSGLHSENFAEYGGFCGDLTATYTSGCSATGSISLDIQQYCFGAQGFVGAMYVQGTDGYIKDCYSDMVIDCQNVEWFDDVAGFIQDFGLANNQYMSNCYAKGSINIVCNDGYLTGGAFLGNISVGDNAYIENSYSTMPSTIYVKDGDCYGWGGFAQGISLSQFGTLRNCYVDADFTYTTEGAGTGIYHGGGFTGMLRLADYSSMWNCYSAGDMATISIDTPSGDPTDFNDFAGFAGYARTDIGCPITNCWTASILNLEEYEDLNRTGGFIGQPYDLASYYALDLQNCAWVPTGQIAGLNAIGDEYYSSTPVPLFEDSTVLYGTDEADATLLQYKEHAVYDPGGGPLTYPYSKTLTASRPTGAVDDYQMVLYVGESSGSVGADVSCEGHCLSTFADLRFWNSPKGWLPLFYWIESVSGTTPNQTAKVWIKLDTIGTTDTPFIMEYGYASASAMSDADVVMIFQESFEDLNATTLKGQGGWFYTTYPRVTASNAYIGSKCMYISSGGLYRGIKHAITNVDTTDYTAGINISVSFAMKATDVSQLNSIGCSIYQSSRGQLEPTVYVKLSEGYLKTLDAGGATFTDVMAISNSTYYNIEIRIVDASTHQIWVNGSLQATNSNAFAIDNHVNVLHIEQETDTASVGYADQVIIRRNFVTNPPTWGTFGAEVEITVEPPSNKAWDFASETVWFERDNVEQYPRFAPGEYSPVNYYTTTRVTDWG